MPLPDKPAIGLMVCDCYYHHQQIIAVDDDGDTITLEDGHVCSYRHCCDEADHGWEHPMDAIMRVARRNPSQWAISKYLPRQEPGAPS